MEGTECDICHEAIRPWHSKEEWGRSPWGDGDGWAHKSCADDWEPSDEQMNPPEWGPTISEQQEKNRRLK